MATNTSEKSLEHAKPTGSREITELLREWTDGDKHALDKVVPMIYDDLRKLARSLLRKDLEKEIFQPTELVDMLYLQIVDQREVHFESRKHFFWYAGQTIRRILVDAIRSKMALKRGHGAVRSLDEDVEDTTSLDPPTLLAIDEALVRLEKIRPRRCCIIEMSNFLGMSYPEIAQVMDLSPTTVRREARAARHWLFFELNRK